MKLVDAVRQIEAAKLRPMLSAEQSSHTDIMDLWVLLPRAPYHPLGWKKEEHLLFAFTVVGGGDCPSMDAVQLAKRIDDKLAHIKAQMVNRNAAA